MGSPVITGLFWGVETDSNYDHIVPIVGYDASSEGGMTAVYFNDLHGNASVRADIDSFVATRRRCNRPERFGPGSFCLPQGTDYGVAVMGNVDDEKELRPARLTMDSWTEPDYSREDAQKESPTLLSATVTASKLAPGMRYAMLRFDTIASVPRAVFLNATYAQKTEFAAMASTWAQRVEFMSNSTQFFRCAEIPRTLA
eukprot:150130-Prymnesium_polylepis.2